MTEKPDYTFMAQRFNNNIGFEESDNTFNQQALDQFEVVEEEFEELKESFYKLDEESTVEEMADVLVTIFVLADRMDVDVEEAYRRKMIYNLSKTGDRDENGKVTDDSELEKPDFSDLV